jgi:hypothetical protein
MNEAHKLGDIREKLKNRSAIGVISEGYIDVYRIRLRRPILSYFVSELHRHSGDTIWPRDTSRRFSTPAHHIYRHGPLLDKLARKWSWNAAAIAVHESLKQNTDYCHQLNRLKIANSDIL